MTTEKTEKKPRAKRPGRPKGSKTRKLSDDDKSLARCPACECTSHRVLSTTTMDHCGTLISGERYTSRVWQRVKCKSKDCGNVWILHSFPFDPAKWPG